MKRRKFLRALIVASAAATSAPLLDVAFEVIKQDPQVQAVLSRLGELTEQEKRAVARFIHRSIKNGTWDKMESFVCHFPDNPQASMIDWKG